MVKLSGLWEADDMKKPELTFMAYSFEFLCPNSFEFHGSIRRSAAGRPQRNVVGSQQTSPLTQDDSVR